MGRTIQSEARLEDVIMGKEKGRYSMDTIKAYIRRDDRNEEDMYYMGVQMMKMRDERRRKFGKRMVLE